MFKVSTHIQQAIDGFASLWFKALPVMLGMFGVAFVASLGIHFGNRWFDYIIEGLYGVASLYYIMVIVNLALNKDISIKRTLHVGLRTFIWAFVAAVIYYFLVKLFQGGAKQIMHSSSVSIYFAWTLVFVTMAVVALMVIHFPLLLIHLQKTRVSLLPAMRETWKIFRSRWEEICLRVGAYVFVAAAFTLGVSLLLGLLAQTINLILRNGAIHFSDNIVASLYFTLLLVPFSVVFYTQLYLDLTKPRQS